MKSMKGLAMTLTVLALCAMGSGWIGCKKKESNNQTSSGGGVPSPAPGTQRLSVAKSGGGTGIVGSDPSGIACGVDCSEDYDQGTVVTLTTASVATGSIFAGWSGACTGTGPCIVTMSVSQSVTAHFDTLAPSVHVEKIGDGVGDVASSPAGISCGVDCTEAYTFNSVITLSAVADAPSSTFAGWGGACSGLGNCVVTVDEAKNVTAQFDKIKFPVTVSLNGTGVGSVTSSPAGINCGLDCSESFAYGTAVVLTAIPQDGFSEFKGWSGGVCLGAGPCGFTIDAAETAIATFDKVDLNGSWTGTTNQGEDMHFIVENDKIRIYGATYTFTGACSFSGWFLKSFGAGSGLEISSLYTFSDAGSAFGIAGAFTSGIQASGTLTRTSLGCGSNTYTWTATKNSGGMGSMSLRYRNYPPPGSYLGEK